MCTGAIDEKKGRCDVPEKRGEKERVFEEIDLLAQYRALYADEVQIAADAANQVPEITEKQGYLIRLAPRNTVRSRPRSNLTHSLGDTDFEHNLR